MFQVKEVSDIFADACVRDDAGNLLFVSLYGRDGALLQLFSAFTLKRDQGGLDGFTLLDEMGECHSIGVTGVDRLEKLSGRLPKANLFGNLAHTWLYDVRLVKRDYVNRIAWVINEVQNTDTASIDQQLREQAWLVMKDLSPIPLLDHWQSTILALTGDQVIQPLAATLYPPIGRVTGFRLELNDTFISTVSDAVRSGHLTVEESAVGVDIAKPVSTPVRVALGQVVMTPGVQCLLADQAYLASTLLRRHQSGDWGCVSAADRQENNQSLEMGLRLISAYPIDASQPSEGHGDNTIWIITEADRSVTTLLLPSEY